MERTKILSAESVTEGHPDKVCDGIADAILDAALERDPRARVACEVLCKGRRVVVAGEITSRASFDREAVVRKTVEAIGYVDPGEEFHASGLEIHDWISGQAPEIASAVGEGADPGARDQGVMFGYATAEKPEISISIWHLLPRREPMRIFGRDYTIMRKCGRSKSIGRRQPWGSSSWLMGDWAKSKSVTMKPKSSCVA